MSREQPRSVAEWLHAARESGLDRLDAHVLLAQVLQRPRTWLLAHDDVRLEPEQAEAYASLVERRVAGEPLAYLVGEKDFHGLMLQVDARVLVPRPDTEVIVDWALNLLDGDLAALPTLSVIDLGTGSGAIALAVKAAQAGAAVLATDISEAALEVARANARHLGLEVAFAAGSWWKAAGDVQFDLALSNPPYIAADDPHLVPLRHEPMLALSPGGDGLDALRAVAGGAAPHLRPGAWLLLEHGHDQGEAVRELLGTHGFIEIATRRDLGGIERCSGGRRPGNR